MIDYKKESWFNDISDTDKNLLESLSKVQAIVGGTKTVASQFDPAKMKEIADKIVYLFPDANFFFYNMVGDKPEEEDEEIKKLITDSMNSSKFYITRGNLEPIHHQEKERAQPLETDILAI